MRQLLTIGALAGAWLATATGAPAQERPAPQCAPRSEIVRALGAGYGERLLVQAPMDDGRLLEIYVADDRRSWTAVAVVPSFNVGCVIASGSDFEILAGGRLG